VLFGKPPDCSLQLTHQGLRALFFLGECPDAKRTGAHGTRDGWGISGNKKPAKGGFFEEVQVEGLLQLDFFVLNVLASFGVELHDRHLLGHCFLVLAGRVEVTSTSCGFQLDFFASAFGCHGV
jgi:hypothetical protein